MKPDATATFEEKENERDVSRDIFESKDGRERQKILDALPQVAPFRFIDEIAELTSHHIVTNCRFRGDAWFYQGHFPGDPVTPGVILVEAMAQAGLVALGLFILSREQPRNALRTLFTECSMEFLGVVKPEQRVTIRAERIFWRRNKLRSKAEVLLDDRSVVAAGILSGMAVRAE